MRNMPWSPVGIRGTDVWGKVGGKMSVSAMEKAMGKSLADTDKEAKMDFDVGELHMAVKRHS